MNITGVKYRTLKINGDLTSEIPVWDRATFLLENDLSQRQIRFVNALLDETVGNGFEVEIEKSK
jgi:hypothetical protein